MIKTELIQTKTISKRFPVSPVPRLWPQIFSEFSEAGRATLLEDLPLIYTIAEGDEIDSACGWRSRSCQSTLPTGDPRAFARIPGAGRLKNRGAGNPRVRCAVFFCGRRSSRSESSWSEFDEFGRERPGAKRERLYAMRSLLRNHAVLLRLNCAARLPSRRWFDSFLGKFCGSGFTHQQGSRPRNGRRGPGVRESAA